MPLFDQSVPFNVRRQLATEEEQRRERDIIDQLHSNREAWINERRDELFSLDENLTMPEAHAQATRDFDEQFGSAISVGYGDASERAPVLPLVGEVTTTAQPRDLPAFDDAPPTLSEVLGTQTVVGEEQRRQEAERAEASTTVDWGEVQNELDVDAPTLTAIQNAFITHSATNISETDQLTLINEVLEELNNIQNAPIMGVVDEGDEAPTTADVFGRQTETTGAPQYTDVQLAFLDTIYKQQVEQAKEELRGETVRVYDVGGVEYPVTGMSPSAFPLDVQHQMTSDNIVERPLTEEELQSRAEETVGQPWYTDPVRVAEQRENPEQFARDFARQESTSILNIQQPFGTSETGAGQFVRLAQSLLSLPMVALLEEAATPQVQAAKGSERAERGGERWREHPYLYNISRGLGATGEAILTADALNIDGALRTAAVAGGFAADLLDPTFGVAMGATRGARVLSQAGRLSKTVEGVRPVRAALQAGAKSFLDDPNLFSIMLRGSGDSRGVSQGARALHRGVGDVRTIVADDITEQVMNRFRKGGVDVIPDDFGFSSMKNELRQLDEVLDGNVPTLTNFLTEPLATTLRNNNDWLRTVRAADIERSASSSPILSWVKALPDEAHDVLRRNIVFNNVLEEVFSNTKNMTTAFDDVIAVTNRTWATEEQARKILKQVNDSDFGRLVQQLEKVGDNYFIPEADTFVFTGELDHLVTTGSLDASYAKRLKTRIMKNGSISPEDLRTIQHLVIDETAIQSTAFRARTTPFLSATQRTALLEPATTRSFGNTVFKQWTERGKPIIFTERAARETTGTVVDVGIKRMVDQAKGKVNALDELLRREVGEVLKNKELVELYNIENKSDALGYLLVREGADVADNLMYVFNHAFYTERFAEKLLKSGIVTESNIVSSIFSDRGTKMLERMIHLLITEAEQRGLRYNLWDYFGGFTEELKVIFSDPSQDHITRALLKSNIEPSDVRTLFGDTKIPPEVQVGAYYNMQTQRIQDQLVVDIIDADPRINTPIIDLLPEYVKVSFSDEAVEMLMGMDKDLISTRLDMLMGSELAAGRLNDTRHALSELDVTDEMFYEYISRVDDKLEMLLRKQPDFHLRGNLETSHRRVMSLLEEEEDLVRVLGEDAAREITDVLQNKMTDFNKFITNSIRANDILTMEAGQKLLDTVNEVRYAALLGIRPRFHGANITTAPFITYAATGHLPSISTVFGRRSASRILAYGDDPIKGNTIAITDPSGRQYTYKEILDTVRSSGVRSQIGFQTQQLIQNDISRWVGQTKNPLRATDVLVSAANQEDLFFRLGVVSDELHKGRTLDDAVRSGREAMLDYNRLSALERRLSRSWFMFYAFSRQTLGQLIRGLSNPKTFKRYINILKFKNGKERLLADIQGDDFTDPIYRPEYAQARIFLDKREGEAQDFGIYSPSIPPIEAIMTLMDLTSSWRGIPEHLGSFVHPNITAALNLPSKFQESTHRVHPEDVASIADLGMSPVEISRLLESTFGGVIEPVPASIEDGAVNGYIYPLTTSAQQNNYRSWISMPWRQIYRTASRDYRRTADPSLVYRGQERPSDSLFYGAGFVTPIRTSTPAEQRRRALEARLRDIRAQLRTLED